MISIIIPLYNKESIIKRTLLSVLYQDYDDYEVIIVDDGSTDKSATVAKRFIDNLPSSKGGAGWGFVQQKNGGPSKARNTGIKHAKGDWILFLDADDELMPDALTIYSKLAEDYSDADIIDCASSYRKGTIVNNQIREFEGYSKKPMRDWYFRRLGPGSNHAIFKTSLLRKYPYDVRLRRYEDAELLTRLLQVSKVYVSKTVTCVVNVVFSSASGARKDIKEDFLGYLDMSKGGFWLRMCVFQLFLSERDHYVKDCKKLYPIWYWRYDLLLLMKLLVKFNGMFL